jgi:hypothetical protein
MLLDLERLRACPLSRDPFDFVVVDNFIRADHVTALLADFPEITGHGSYPLEVLRHGPAFAGLAAELCAAPLRGAIEEKFELDLDGRPTMITLRGHSDGKDGAIHTDSATKIITLLLYMNPEWHEAAGRLRVLRQRDSLDDYVVEVAPLAGTMIAFRRGDSSFHGHHAHVGKRCSVQLNWVTDANVVRREIARHRWSARLKALNPFARPRVAA